MSKLPVKCPACGGYDTIRTKGPQGLCNDCFQQRHECRECGQRFLAFWDMTGTRQYGKAEGPKKPDMKQFSLPMEI